MRSCSGRECREQFVVPAPDVFLLRAGSVCPCLRILGVLVAPKNDTSWHRFGGPRELNGWSRCGDFCRFLRENGIASNVFHFRLSFSGLSRSCRFCRVAVGLFAFVSLFRLFPVMVLFRFSVSLFRFGVFGFFAGTLLQVTVKLIMLEVFWTQCICTIRHLPFKVFFAFGTKKVRQG